MRACRRAGAHLGVREGAAAFESELAREMDELSVLLVRLTWQRRDRNHSAVAIIIIIIIIIIVMRAPRPSHQAKPLQSIAADAEPSPAISSHLQPSPAIAVGRAIGRDPSHSIANPGGDPGGNPALYPGSLR